MDRPSRKTKAVNYCEGKEFGDDDEDFAVAKAPPSKKSKEAPKQVNNRKSISSQESNSQSASSQTSRKPLDAKIYERDLQAAISLSLLNPPNEPPNLSLAVEDDVIIVQTAADENTEPPVLHLSNCSVDGVCLGLDQITSDSTTSKEKRETSDVHRNKPKTQDEDYQPCVASDSESDNDYSEHESEDEEFTVKKKATKTKKEQVTKETKAKKTPPTAKEKKPRKSKSTAVSTPTRTPLTSKNTPEPVRSGSLKATKPCLSPGVSKVPKWNPPGQIGKSPSSSSSTPVRSPGQGLRLGLSRLVRVKPLHPSVTSH